MHKLDKVRWAGRIVEFLESLGCVKEDIVEISKLMPDHANIMAEREEEWQPRSYSAIDELLASTHNN